MGTKITAPITSATKFIEIITVSIASSPLALNTHIINMVQTEFAKIPNAPPSDAGSICFNFWLFEFSKSFWVSVLTP